MEKLNHIKYALEQIVGKGNTDLVESIFSENYIAHSSGKNFSGPHFIKRFAKQIRTAIPDIKILSVDLLSQTETTVTCLRTFSGTHLTSMKGIPPSNKKIKWYEMAVAPFENESIIEEWVISDLAAQLMLKHK